MPTIDSTERTLYLTSMDLRRLRDVVATAQELANGNSPQGIKELETLLKKATIAPEAYLPAAVATLGSKVRIRDEASGETREVILALPGDCLDSQECLSILDPLGSAALGREAGSRFAYAGNPSTKHATLVEVVFQRIDCQWC